MQTLFILDIIILFAFRALDPVGRLEQGTGIGIINIPGSFPPHPYHESTNDYGPKAGHGYQNKVKKAMQ